MAFGGVNAYAHDLGIILGELAQTSIGRRKLGGSNRRPVGHVESKDYMLFAAVILQLDFVFLGSGYCANFEFRSEVPNLRLLQWIFVLRFHKRHLNNFIAFRLVRFAATRNMFVNVSLQQPRRR